MTQRLALGITVGASRSVVVASAADDVDGDSARVTAHPSVLRLAANAAPAFGSQARPGGRHSGGAVLEGFLARVGDPVAILAEDGSEHVAEDLVATAIGCLVDEAAPQGDPVVIACHPAWWSRHTVESQRAALARAGLDEVTLVPEPAAVLRLLDGGRGPREDGAVVVYDLGATGLTVTVLRTGVQSGPLAAPLRSTEVAGAEFDLLTMRYVLANAMGENDFDPFDPAVERELSALRERCRKAKEALSRDTATVVEVRVDPAAGPQRIRLVRGEVEDLLRGPLLTSAELVRNAVHRAGLDLGDVGRIVLTGGGGAIPLVTEILSSEFGLPVVATGDPENAAARGAALLAADLASTELQDAPVTAGALDDDTETTRIPVVAPLPELPDPPQPRSRYSGRQRAGIVAGAATVLALLATGTVAIGTSGFGSGSGSETPASIQNSTPGAPGAAGVAATGDPAAPGTPQVVLDATGQPVAVAPGTPGSTAAGVPGTVAPGVAAAEPGQPAQPGSPAPAAPGNPAPNSPAPAPAPGNPAPAPAPQQPTYPQPQVPTAPGGVVRDTVEGVGGAVGGVVEGAGEGVGSVLDGVGGVVGGVGEVLGGSGG